MVTGDALVVVAGLLDANACEGDMRHGALTQREVLALKVLVEVAKDAEAGLAMARRELSTDYTDGHRAKTQAELGGTDSERVAV